MSAKKHTQWTVLEAARVHSPSLPDRRDTGNWLDRSCEWAVAYPWRIAVMILACIAIVSFIDGAVI